MEILRIEYSTDNNIIKNNQNKYWTEEMAWLNGKAWFNTSMRLSLVNAIVSKNFEAIQDCLSKPNAFYGTEKYERYENKHKIDKIIDGQWANLRYTHTACSFPYKDEASIFFIADLFSIRMPIDFIEYREGEDIKKAYTTKQMLHVMRNVS